MRILFYFFCFVSLNCALFSNPNPENSALSSIPCFRIDLAPAGLRVDVLQNNQTVHRVDLFAARLDASYCFCGGWTVKSCFNVAPKENNHSSLFSTSLAIGHYLPPFKKCLLNPNIGCTYTNFQTTFKDTPVGDLKQRFYSVSPFIGLDLTYLISNHWRAYLSWQYSWSRTHTKIANIPSSKDHSQGNNLGLVLEKDINKQWSINAGAGYNLSMSKEKHGIRVIGGKIGLTYWY